MKFCSKCQRCYEDDAVSCTEKGHNVLAEISQGRCEMIVGYRLEYLLSSGVRGNVFRARRQDCGQPCVIRMIAADAEHAGQFLAEARLAASLFHPNLGDVYEAGTLETGEVFVVAEDTGCQTVRELLDSTDVPPLLTSIQIVRAAAEALDELHLKGLIHRAVRPENIVLVADPEQGLIVRLQDVDFGGVVEHSIISNKFTIDSAIDSLRYFSPEQVTGEKVGMESDVYSLGIVFYEMLAGAPPFDDTKAAGVIGKHKNERPADIKIDDFELRMLVTHAVSEALQKRPDKRQASANTLARQLRHIEQLATHVSTPPPAVTLRAKPAVVVEPTPARVAQEELPATVATAPRRVEAHVEERSFVEDVPVVVVPREPVGLTEIPDEDHPHSARKSRLKLHRKRTHARDDEEVGHAEEVRAAAAYFYNAPTKVEWNQPEDDIPSLEDVAAVLEVERILESAATPEFSDPPRPRKIEWDVTDDDIPSLDDVAKVLADEPIDVTQISEEALDDLPVDEGLILPPARKEAKPVRGFLSRVAARTAPPVASQPASKHRGKAAPIRTIDYDEEITQVRPPSRIRIDLKKPSLNAARFSPVIPSEINFFPTILGGSNEPDEFADAILGADELDERGSRLRSYGPLIGTVILIAMIAAYVIMSDSAGRFWRSESAEVPVAAKTSSVKDSASQQPTQVSDAVPIPKTNDAVTVDKPVTGDVVLDTDRPEPVAAKTRSVVSDERPQPAVVRSVERKSVPIASTLVISSEGGKIVTRTEVPAGAMRPRVVKDPKP